MRVFLGALLLLVPPGLNLPRGSRARATARRAGIARAAASQEAAALAPGPGFDVALAGGQTHTYRISADADQYLRAVVEQRGIVVMTALYDPEGKEVVRMESPAGAHGPIYLSAITGSAGVYSLKVHSTETWANAGRYKVSVEELRGATPSDRERVAAERAYADARQLAEGRAPAADDKEDPLKKYRDARLKFEESLAYWQRVGDPHWIAVVEYFLGVMHRSLGDRPAAAEHFDKALAVQLAEVDWRLRASLFNDRGLNYSRLGQMQKAAESLNEAYRIYHQHGDRRGQASALNNIGFLHLAGGRYREALDIFRQALPLRRAENDLSSEAILLNNIGGVSERLGEPRAALEGFSRAIQIWQELESRGQLRIPVTTRAAGYNNVALAYDRLGEWQQALESYEKALSLFEKAAPDEAAKTLDNIGELYAALGEPGRAKDYYRRARALAAGKDPGAEANVLSHIGQVSVSEGHLSDALAHFERALALRKNAHEKANALTNIGAVYVLQGNPRKALDAYGQALKLSEGGNDPRGLAFVLHKRGEAHALLGERARALEDFNRALPLWKAIADRRGEAATSRGLALIERDAGNLPAALAHIQESIDIVESLRTKVASERLRSAYFATQQNHYELYIDIRMRAHRLDGSPEHLAAALEASERSRARSLVETLTEARADISRGVGEDLLRQERDAQQRLNDKARVQTEVLARKHSAEEAANIERELNEAVAAYDAVKAKIRTNSPTYARLTQPQALSLREIQQTLDKGTLLLEYFLGEERSYLWLVGSSSVVGVETLPNRAEIESRARAFYQSLAGQESGTDATRGRRGGGPGDGAAGAPAASRAADLSRMLLGPVADRIAGKRLLIVGDGILQYMPFGALPTPNGRKAAAARNRKVGRAPYLVEEHEIVYLPSASALAALRTETGGRTSGPLSVAVLADPVFDDEDERLKAVKGRAPSAGQTDAQPQQRREPAGARVLRSGLKLVPLPATEREALAIRDSIPPPGRTKIALGFEASRATVLKLQDEHYRIIHFATHGDLDAERPELSSIALSMRDAEGRPQDGFLRLHDIYNLKLPADLVVLSACKTGLGRVVKGEGLVGLTRGFMYAGAPRVLASLWRVDDLGTSELMRRFYRHMTTGGLTPPAALRQAQVEMLRGKRWRSPYHWAGFVLQGEWEAIR